MHDLVLIEKIPPSSDCWPNLIRDKKILDLSVEEVINKYQGFEGELICLFKVEENRQELEKFINQCLELKKLSSCLLLHVISGSEVMPSSLREQAVFVGYDIGACDEEKTLYSSLFNEVLFGGYEELIAYKDLLNDNLLFPDKATAERYVDLHNKMSAQGKNVEDYMEMIIYEIWKYKG
ncbi:MAG: hypothetical protein CK425_01165 [Parachlamydia sp.]|nr:MAG: hypothetical protein CK425_01165 [Parachlamydia sp.]